MTSRPDAPPELLAASADIHEHDAVAAASVVLYGAGGRLMGDSFCNGVLIGKRLVLTAGHCLRSIGKPYFVNSFAYWRLPAVQDPKEDELDYHGPDGVAVSRFIFHPGFDRDFSERAHPNDLAIAELTSDLPDWAQPVSLPSAQLPLTPARTPAVYAKTQNELWQQLTGDHLYASSYAPFGHYKGFVTVFAKLPMAYVAPLERGTVLGLVPRAAGLIIRGDSGSGVYADIKGLPQLVGVLTAASFDQPTFQTGKAVDLRAYLPWLAETMRALSK